MADIALTREIIVAEAVRLADAGGLEKVSMRRIAEALGAGVMSLYRHIPDKDALLQEMATAVGADYLYPPELLGDPDWRARVHLAVELDMLLYRHHPWVLLAHVDPRSGATGPTIRCFDWLTEALLHLTGTVDTAAELAMHVWNHVLGAGVGAVGRQLLAPGAESDGAGLITGLAGNPACADLPRMVELTARDRPELGDVSYLLRGGIDALCDGFAAKYQGTPPAGS